MKTRRFLLAVVLACLPVIAVAGSAHFVGTPTLTTSGDTVFTSGKVAGLGNIPQIHVTLTGDARCVNHGGNKPQAENKTSVNAEGDFPVQNGRANFSLSADAVFSPDCSQNMTVEWSNLRVTVTADDGTFLTYP